MSVIPPKAQDLIGVDYPSVVYDVDRSAIRLWARAVGYTDPMFYDEEHARKAGHPSLPAPPGFLGHERYGPEGEIGSKGPPVWTLNPALPRRLLGGTEFEYLATVYAGDVLVATSRITDLQERAGSLGPMLIVNHETVYRRNGEPVVVKRATAITY